MGERIEPPFFGGEREMLSAYLDYHRATLAMKCAGLSAADLRRRAVPPSKLSLLGLVRHMSEVERGWFRMAFSGEGVPMLYGADNPDADFDGVDDADSGAAFAAWEGECEHSRAVVGNAESLDDTGAVGIASLRWILLHVIEEYARHNGHADLLRESIDGVVGD